MTEIDAAPTWNELCKQNFEEPLSNLRQVVTRWFVPVWRHVWQNAGRGLFRAQLDNKPRCKLRLRTTTVVDKNNFEYVPREKRMKKEEERNTHHFNESCVETESLWPVFSSGCFLESKWRDVRPKRSEQNKNTHTQKKTHDQVESHAKSSQLASPSYFYSETLGFIFFVFLRRCGVKDNVITVVSGSASIDLWWLAGERRSFLAPFAFFFCVAVIVFFCCCCSFTAAKVNGAPKRRRGGGGGGGPLKSRAVTSRRRKQKGILYSAREREREREKERENRRTAGRSGRPADRWPFTGRTRRRKLVTKEKKKRKEKKKKKKQNTVSKLRGARILG